MNKLSAERQGELFIFGEAALWSLFPIITILSYNKVSPLMSLSVSSLFAALFFGAVITLKKSWQELLNKSALKNILLATFFIGILYYVFYFFGLRYTSAGNASIISLSEVFFSYIFFHVLKKDYIPLEHLIGSALMIAGALVVLYPNMHKFQPGDILILIAAFIAPFGNYYVRKARKVVSTESIMFVRSVISGIVIFIFALVIKGASSYLDVKSSLLFLIINGVFLLGLSKIMWIEGIHRISVTKANALGSLSPLLTLFFVWIFFKTSPTVWQSFSFVPMFFGVVLLGKDLSKHT